MSDSVPDPRRKRLRAEGFDYSTHGSYYVTICVDEMGCRFGHVSNGVVVLNTAGRLVDDAWKRIPRRFPEAILDAWVVMPNHLHGIVFIDRSSPTQVPSLSRIIQAFKSETTVEYGHCVRAGMFPPYRRGLWQRGFHDRIIRNDRMLDIDRAYIEGNPGRWRQQGL
jgi:REP element-mobilizing transposase RayT